MKKHSFTLVELMVIIAIIALVGSGLISMVRNPKMLTQKNLVAIEGTKSIFPDPSGYVVDTINLLDSATKVQIETICSDLDPIAQVAVCIIDTTGSLSIEEYGIKLAEKWKVGYADKDNGIILILAKTDHKVRIEVGRGLEPIINDAKAGAILDSDVIPFFKQNRYALGLLSGIQSIERILRE